MFPEKGDVLMTRIGDVGTANVVIDNTPKAYYVTLALFKQKELDPQFLKASITAPFVQKEIWYRTLHIAFPKKINMNEIAKVRINTPCSDEEQKRLGIFFQNIDKQIKLHQSKLDKLQQLKKSMLGKMFPKAGAKVPEVRFAGFRGDWEIKDFTSVVDFYSGLTYSPQSVVKSNGTLVLRSSNVQNGQLTFDDNVYVHEHVVNSQNVEAGDIVVVVRNGSRALIGKHAVVLTPMSNTVIGAFMTGIRTNQSKFINALLDTSLFQKEVEKNLGATINQITAAAFKSMEFAFPVDQGEQSLIGEYFDKMDRLIALQQKHIDKLKTSNRHA